MNFTTHYFNEENINEINWLKSNYFGNAFKSLIGSGKRKVNPKDFKQFTQLTPNGFVELFTTLDNRYKNQKQLKYNIKNMYTALFNPKEATEVFPYKDNNGQIKTVQFDSDDPKSQIKSSAYYETNKGGRIMLVSLNDDEEKIRYFIGLDGNANKFFNAPVKKGGIGKDFKTWLATQAAATYKPDKATMSPEFPGAGENGENKPKSAADAGLLKFKYKVPENKYNEMIPKGPIRLAASYEYSKSLLDIYEDEVLEAKKSNALEIDGKKAVTTKNGEWYRLTATNKNIVGSPILTFTNNLIAVNSKGEKDNDLQDELNKEIEREKEEKKNKETGTENKKEIEKDDEHGTLYNDLKDELNPNHPPTEVKPSKKTKNGWRFMLNNGGIIFIYTTTDGKRLIGFDDKSKKIVDSKDLIKKYNLEISNENPEIESPE